MLSALLMVALAGSPEPATKVVAVFPFSGSSKRKRDRIAAKFYFKRTLPHIAELTTNAGIEVLAGRALKRTLGQSPTRAAARCGADAACAAALGRAVGATEILIGQAGRRGSLADLILLVIATETEEILRTEFVTLTPREIDTVIPATVGALFELANPTTDDPGADDLIALPDLPDLPGDVPTPLPALPQDPPIETVLAAPTQAAPPPTQALTTPSNSATDVPQTESQTATLPRIGPPVPAAPSTLEDATAGANGWLISGLIGLGLGVAGAGVGGGLGMMRREAARDPAQGETQIQYANRIEDANTMGGVANIAFIAAGAAGAVGAVLTVIGLVVDDDVETHTETSIATSHADGRLGLP